MTYREQVLANMHITTMVLGMLGRNEMTVTEAERLLASLVEPVPTHDADSVL